MLETAFDLFPQLCIFCQSKKVDMVCMCKSVIWSIRAEQR